MAYIIGTYNKWDAWDRKHSRYIFQINEIEYAIKQVRRKNGEIELPLRIEDENQGYCVYDKYEDAMRFVSFMKSIN